MQHAVCPVQVSGSGGEMIVKWMDILDIASFVSAEEGFLGEGEVITEPLSALPDGTKMWHGERRQGGVDLPSMVMSDGKMVWSDRGIVSSQCGHPLSVSSDGGTYGGFRGMTLAGDFGEMEYAGVSYYAPYWLTEIYEASDCTSMQRLHCMH